MKNFWSLLEDLAILEAAVLECKKRDINTPEVKEALDLLEPYIWPKWMIPEFRHHTLQPPLTHSLEGTQQILRATFPGIRDCVRELLSVRMDRFVLKFHETKDMAMPDEIYRLSRELIKLNEPWEFRAR